MDPYILRSTTEYADKDGREISLRKREELFADPAYRTLRIREPGSPDGALVYTFWCGILPLVYETEIIAARGKLRGVPAGPAPDTRPQAPVQPRRVRNG